MEGKRLGSSRGSEASNEASNESEGISEADYAAYARFVIASSKIPAAQSRSRTRTAAAATGARREPKLQHQRIVAPVPNVCDHDCLVRLPIGGTSKFERPVSDASRRSSRERHHHLDEAGRQQRAHVDLRDLAAVLLQLGGLLHPPRGPCDGVETRTTREMTTNRAWTSEVPWLAVRPPGDGSGSETRVFSNKVNRITCMPIYSKVPQLPLQPSPRPPSRHAFSSGSPVSTRDRSQTCGRSRPRRLDSD